ncbi:MAG TPA: hypothetical protein VHW01_02440 [Polyangiaceae bacterium]|jgi:hypothetical protein|nr:hypothetical protein [Polyangiaceae bacterium]
MSTNDRRLISLRPSSAPPESTAQVDASWDDETVPGLDLDDPLNEFDRVTAIPELPPEVYAQRMMEAAKDSRIPTKAAPLPEPPPPPPPPGEYFSFDSGPPPGKRSAADSTAPYAAISAQNAPTARPAPSAKPAQPTVPARSPGVPPFSPSPTGLELADLNFDSLMSIKAGARVETQVAHDPRDPVLELSFEEVGASELPKEPDSGPVGDMKDRYAMGDFSGALVIAEGILESNPEDLEAPRYAQSCRDVLTQMYSARLGSLDQVVAIAVPSDQIRWLTLDHRAGFLLSLVDGGSTVDQILDISGMTRLDALRIMYQLLDQRVISLG